MDIFSESLAGQEGLLTGLWLLRPPSDDEERQKVEEVRALFRPSTWWGEVKALVNGRPRIGTSVQQEGRS